MPRKTIDFGIDLGTTNSAIARMQDGAVEIIKNSLTQSDVTPSAVRIDKRGSIIVGENAYRSLNEEPEDTAAEFKLAMGRKADAQYHFKKSGRSMTAGELSAEVLKVLRADAMRRGEPVDAAVITVPAMFSTAACDETRDAARLSGFEQVALLQEPVAAALAYGLSADSQTGTFLVYDLGGGTFDCSLITCKAGRFVVLGNSGDEHLGGKEFDWAIFQFMLDSLTKQGYNTTGIGRENRNPAARRAVALLKRSAEDAKKVLSVHERSTIEVRNLGQGFDDIDTHIEITRADFELLIQRYVSGSLVTCDSLLASKKVSPRDIERVLLVGGPTLTPYVRESLRERFGDAVYAGIDPMTVVAKGAAIFAATQKTQSSAGAPKDAREAILRLKVVYTPTCHEPEQEVGFVIGDEVTCSTIEIIRSDGGWSSGSMPIPQNRKIKVKVPLRPRRANTFEAIVRDDKGNPRTVHEPEFTITHGMPTAQVVLSRSFGVALTDNEFQIVLAKDTPLPGRGVHRFRTASQCSSSEPLRIYVLEGEQARADRNIAVGILEVKPTMRKSIPAGQDIEVTLKMDESRQLIATAYLPLTNEVFEDAVTVDLHTERLNDAEIGLELNQERRRFEKTKPGLEPSDIDEIEHLFSDCNTEFAAAQGGDPAAQSRVTRRILELKLKLDFAWDASEWKILSSNLETSLEWLNDLLGWFSERGDLSVKEREMLSSAESKVRQAAKKGPVAALRDALENLWSLCRSILYEKESFWLWQFEDLQEEGKEFVDHGRAGRLMEEGKRAVNRQDVKTLQTIVRDLWNLELNRQRGILDDRFADAGVSRSQKAGK